MLFAVRGLGLFASWHFLKGNYGKGNLGLGLIGFGNSVQDPETRTFLHDYSTWYYMQHYAALHDLLVSWSMCQFRHGV